MSEEKKFMSCEICGEKYEDKNKHKPLVGKCGHTMCETCVKNIDIKKDCPFCKSANSFDKCSTNFEFLHMLQLVEKNIKDEEEKEKLLEKCLIHTKENAHSYCLNCSKFLCINCIKDHILIHDVRMIREQSAMYLYDCKKKSKILKKILNKNLI